MSIMVDGLMARDISSLTGGYCELGEHSNQEGAAIRASWVHDCRRSDKTIVGWSKF